MADPQKASVGQKTKQVINNAKGKSRDGLDRAYQTKRPLAVENLKALRLANPNHTPAQIQTMIEEGLRAAEIQLGTGSVKFSTATSLFVFTALELRQLEGISEAQHQKYIDQMVILDSSALRAVRRAGLFVATVGTNLFPQLRSAKVISYATRALLIAKKTAKLSGAKPNQVRASNTIISYTSKTLGPVPSDWLDAVPKLKPRKRFLEIFKK
jgi:hypothetical protein